VDGTHSIPIAIQVGQDVARVHGGSVPR
jgi:hypothetical protein